MYPGLQTVYAQDMQPLEQPMMPPQQAAAPMAPVQQIAPLGVGNAPVHEEVHSPGTTQYMQGLKDYFVKQAKQQQDAAKDFQTGYHPLQVAQARFQ